MQIHGSLAANLKSAVLSARRLRLGSVYTDTLEHWMELARQGHTALEAEGPEDVDADEIRRLTGELEAEIENRAAPPPAGNPVPAPPGADDSR
jgi:hypothetical protein